MEKRKKTLLILGLCIFTLALAGLSYALWVITLQQDGENEIATACLDIEKLEEGTGITLNPGYPISDTDGEALDPYTFKIYNKCQDNLQYQINVEVLDDTTLNSKYIKVKLNEVNAQGTIQYLKESVNPTLTTGESIAKEAYKIETGYLTSDETKSFEFRQWMDGDIKGTETESMNKVFKSKITITATYKKVIPETQKEVFPGVIADQLDEEGNGLITQEHGEDETFPEGDEGFRNSEYRFVGTKPNNYVWFNCTEETTSGEENCEKWRIIGLVNVKTETGITQRVKIIRDKSIGEYSWDSSGTDVNHGDGVNEWSQADLMKLLNPGYEDNKSEGMSGEEQESNANNSLYWLKQSGNCYTSQGNDSETCDFTSKGMKDETKQYIADDIIWNTGSNGENDYKDETLGLPKHFYEYERSNNTKKICSTEDSSGHYCNDEVERKLTWQRDNIHQALVGLMYPSDYGYAVGGVGNNR